MIADYAKSMENGSAVAPARASHELARLTHDIQGFLHLPQDVRVIGINSGAENRLFRVAPSLKFRPPS